MLTARDIMTPHPLSVTVGAKVTEAARLMLEHHFNGLPVVDPDAMVADIMSMSAEARYPMAAVGKDGQLKGIVTKAKVLSSLT